MRYRNTSINLKTRYRTLRIEPLESRRMLATLVNAKTVTYQDVDGDTVTVALSSSLLTAANVNSVFSFDSGNVNGSNSAPQRLQTLNLTNIGTTANGVSLTITAKPSPTLGGDGLVQIGEISAFDLGTVSIHGDLEFLQAGNGTSKVQGVAALNVQSINRLPNNSVRGIEILGRLGKLTVASDIYQVNVDAGAGSRTPASIGSISIGGSLFGGHFSGEGVISTTGDIGAITIGRDLVGGDDTGSGAIEVGGKIASLKIGGSIIGGSGTNTGYVEADGGITGATTIGGSIIGGSGFASGEISSVGNMGSLTVGGSIVGGNNSQFAGSVRVTGNLGAVTIGGNLQGGTADDSGVLLSTGSMGAVKIGGSVIGGIGARSAEISAESISGVTVSGSVTGGAGPASALILASEKIGNLSITGDLVGSSGQIGGSIRSAGTIGAINIGGSIINAVISAFGQTSPKAPNDLAITSLTVGGRMDFAAILAGYDTSGNPESADAQIGNVTVHGDWINSYLLAGVEKTNPVTLKKISTNDNPAITSSIGAIVIGGEVIGDPAAIGIACAFSAEQIKSFSVAGTVIPLHSGPHNDDFRIGPAGENRLEEV
jgi:hypothetical protein